MKPNQDIKYQGSKPEPLVSTIKGKGSKTQKNKLEMTRLRKRKADFDKELLPARRNTQRMNKHASIKRNSRENAENQLVIEVANS